MKIYKIALYKEAEVGDKWLENLEVPQENIPALMDFFESIEDRIGPVLVNKFIKQNPQISVDELKNEYLKNFAKQTQFGKLSPEIQSKVNQTTQDKDEKEWVAKILNEGSMQPHDLPMIKNSLEQLHSLSDKKINEFQNFQELSQFISKFRQNVSEDREKSLDPNSYKLLENSNGVQLYFINCDTPEGQKALDTLGEGANWCVLSPTKIAYNPHEYYMFVIDGMPEVLVHPQSNQIKDSHDGALRDGFIVKTIGPFVEKHNLNTGNGDFYEYNRTIEELKEFEQGNENFINEKIREGVGKFMLVPKEKWHNHIGVVANSLKENSRIIVNELNREALAFLTDYVKINNDSEKLNDLENCVAYWFHQDNGRNLTVGRYDKIIPNQLHTPRLNKIFNEQRLSKIEEYKNEMEEIYNETSDNPDYKSNLWRKFRQCPFKEVKNDPKVREIIHSYWRERVLGLSSEDEVALEDCPYKPVREDPEIWKEYIIQFPYLAKYCPLDEVRNDPKVWRDAVREDILALVSTPFEEIKDDIGLIKESLINDPNQLRAIEYLDNEGNTRISPRFKNKLSDIQLQRILDLKNDPDFIREDKKWWRNAFINETVRMVNILTCPYDDVRYDPKLWEEKIRKEPDHWASCPLEEVKNNPELKKLAVDAFAERVKDNFSYSSSWKKYSPELVKAFSEDPEYDQLRAYLERFDKIMDNPIKASSNNWYKTALRKEAKVGDKWLENLKVPQENIPAFMDFFNSIEDKIGQTLVNKFVSKNPQISLDELKNIYNEKFAKETEFSKLSPEIQSKVNQTTQDKDEKEWVAKILNEGSMVTHDLPMIKNSLEELHSLSDKKINEFQNFQDLSEYLSQFRQERSQESTKELSSDSYKLLENSNGVQLYFINAENKEGQKALDTLGEGAQWCVLSKNGKVSYKPKAYYMFVIDGSPEVLAHPQSNQIKDSRDGSLKNGNIIKKINPYVQKHNLDTKEGEDSIAYDETLKRLDEYEKNSDDIEWVERELVKSQANFMLIPEEKWNMHVNSLAKYFNSEAINALDYKAIDLLANYLKINGIDNRFSDLEDSVAKWFSDSDNNCTVGRYNKIIPQPLHTTRVSQMFKEKREVVLNEWIKKINLDPYDYEICPEEFKNDERIQEAHLNGWIKNITVDPYDYKDCPEEFKNDPRIKEVALNYWINRITRKASIYKKCPEEFKNDPRIQEAHLNYWINRITVDPDYYGDCPEELKNDERIQEAHLNGWIKKITKYPDYEKDCPEELKNDERIQEAHLNYWINKITGNADYYGYCPEEFKNDPRIQEAHLNYWINNITEYADYYYEICPEEFKNDERIQKAHLNGWINNITRNPYDYEFCPEEFKNDERIQEVALNGWIKNITVDPYDYKDCPEEFKNDERIKEVALNYWINRITRKAYLYKNCPEEFKNDPRIISILPDEMKPQQTTANNARLNSSAFNDNYIGKLS